MGIALSALRTLVRQRTGFESVTSGGTDSLVPDAELNSYINQSLAELHDKLTVLYEDYFTLSTVATVATGANTIATPANFNKVIRLQYRLDGTRYAKVPRFEMEEIERANGIGRTVNGGYSQRMYRLIGGTMAAPSIFLLPEDGADGTYRLWYTARYTTLSSDSDEWTDPQGWYEYAVADACIKCLAKENSDPSVFMAQKAQLLARIESSASNRDAGSPGRVQDVRWSRDFDDSDSDRWGGF